MWLCKIEWNSPVPVRLKISGLDFISMMPLPITF